MGTWGRAYYQATQGGTGDGGHHYRARSIIKTPADFDAIGRAQEKRIRKAKKVLKDHEKQTHTHAPKLVIRP